jgi:hypothetical protein
MSLLVDRHSTCGTKNIDLFTYKEKEVETKSHPHAIAPLQHTSATESINMRK